MAGSADHRDREAHRICQLLGLREGEPWYAEGFLLASSGRSILDVAIFLQMSERIQRRMADGR